MTISLQQIIADTIQAVPEVLPYLSERARVYVELRRKAVKAGDYDAIRFLMRGAVYDAVEGFLSGNSHAGTYSRPLATAISKAYIDAAPVAYDEGGGSLPLDDDTAAWARAELDAQLAFVDSLFETLKQLRKEGDFDAAAEAASHAEGYSSSLDGYYNAVKLRAAGNKMLTFTRVRNTKDSCDSCVRLRGQRHRASWWVAHDFVPPTGGGLDCAAGGHCGDVLMTDDGEEFTI